MKSNYEALMQKFYEDELFRRLAIGTGSATFYEMVAQAIMKDRTGQEHLLSVHNAQGVDLIDWTGKTYQVKTINSEKSFVCINHGRETADQVMIFVTFLKPARFFLIPMSDFKGMSQPRNRKGATVDRAIAERWELSAARIKAGVLDPYEITPA